jgi:ubiquinone/menaquinone biosynthesis C-methylase UbiE
MRYINQHFSKIAPKYRELRNTDLEPIRYIKKTLKHLTNIEAADVGCGAGRYDISLFQSLKGRLYLHCIDSNQDMLNNLQSYLSENKITEFEIKQAYAHDLPIKDRSLNCVFTFNAVHHFKLNEFLNEAIRVMKDEGYLFIYTRLRSQNLKSVWGKHFPLFNEKEDRLYELNELREILGTFSNIKTVATECFKFQRKDSLENLLEQAKNFHYSTFYLYSAVEFEQCLDAFIKNIHRNYPKVNDIRWFDENIMLVIQKSANGSPLS